MTLDFLHTFKTMYLNRLNVEANTRLQLFSLSWTLKRFAKCKVMQHFSLNFWGDGNIRLYN